MTVEKPSALLTARPLKIVIVLISLAAIGLMLISMLIEWNIAQTTVLPSESGDFMIGLAFVLLAVVGAVAAMGQPRNGVGWVLLAVGFGASLAAVSGAIATHYEVVELNPLNSIIAEWLGTLGWYGGLLPLLCIFPFIFPDGHLSQGRFWRPVFIGACLFVALIIGGTFVNGLVVFLSGQIATGNEFGLFIEQIMPFSLIPLLLGIASLVVRYRQSHGDQRRQLKWLVLTVGVALFTFAVFGALEENGIVTVSNLLWGLVYLAIPLGLGVALLRYRMFDVDKVVRKTGQYAIVTILLGVVYFGLIILFQQVFSDVTGQTSKAAVVLSTLLIAALFNPVRRRVQAFIDRRFYRQAYDAEQVLEKFAATVRDETDLDALTIELVRVIQETMQPNFVSVWLRPAQEIAFADSTADSDSSF